MEHNKIQQQHDYQTSYLVQQNRLPSEDEISLQELWFVLVKQKKTIVVISIVVTLLSLVYALTAPVVYRAEIQFLPPLDKDIQPLNIPGLQNLTSLSRQEGQVGVSIDSVYSIYKQNLASRRFQEDFFRHSSFNGAASNNDSVLGSFEQRFDSFAERLDVVSKKISKHKLSFIVEWNSPEVAAKIANDFSYMVDRKTVQQLVENLQNAINNRIGIIQNTIASKRKIAKQRREDLIAGLDEAVLVASSLGIIDPIAPHTVRLDSVANDLVDIFPLYHRGERALRTEIEVLKNRASDDPFIHGLRDLQEELVRLQSIKLNEQELKVASVDRKAYPPERPIKPKRRLIIVTGAILGFLLSVFVVFFLHFIVNKEGNIDSKFTEI